LAHQPQEEASSAGEQLVSNRDDAYTKKEGLIIYLFSPTFFGKPYGSQNSFVIG
jgi:hypothetical protein